MARLRSARRKARASRRGRQISAVWPGSTRWSRRAEPSTSGGNGYPLQYGVRVADLLPIMASGLPGARKPWNAAPHDVLGDKWDGATTVDGALATRSPEEWLIVEAWDES